MENTVMMTPDMQTKLKRSLINHEGYRKFIYTDSAGKLTGGIGYNFTDRGLSDDWINRQYQEDVTFFYDQLYNDFEWFRNLNPDRQIALIDMAFMGWKKFIGFKKMIAALEKGDFKQAALEMLDSRWAQQVKTRATTLATAILQGVYNP